MAGGLIYAGTPRVSKWRILVKMGLVEEARAKFEAGLMPIDVPFEDTMRGHKVTVE